MSDTTALATTTHKAAAWWTPRNIEDAVRLAGHIAQSGLVPKQYVGKPESVLVAMMFGDELGMGPMAALQSIQVINGTPSLFGDAPLALCRRHSDWEGIEETYVDDPKHGLTAVCTVKRRGEPVHTERFSVAEAKLAGLWGKAGPWTQYPKRMLRFRARGYALRDVFPDAIKGMGIVETADQLPAPMKNITPTSTHSRSLPEPDAEMGPAVPSIDATDEPTREESLLARLKASGSEESSSASWMLTPENE
jgi:hypothetical protein